MLKEAASLSLHVNLSTTKFQLSSITHTVFTDRRTAGASSRSSSPSELDSHPAAPIHLLHNLSLHLVPVNSAAILTHLLQHHLLHNLICVHLVPVNSAATLTHLIQRPSSTQPYQSTPRPATLLIAPSAHSGSLGVDGSQDSGDRQLTAGRSAYDGSQETRQLTAGPLPSADSGSLAGGRHSLSEPISR